ncbi:MAG: hypothetical protein ABL931_12285, partial [Usitatibacteraceae bacterium]
MTVRPICSAASKATKTSAGLKMVANPRVAERAANSPASRLPASALIMRGAGRATASTGKSSARCQ